MQTFESYINWRDAVRQRNLIVLEPRGSAHKEPSEADLFEPTIALDKDFHIVGFCAHVMDDNDDLILEALLFPNAEALSLYTAKHLENFHANPTHS